MRTHYCGQVNESLIGQSATVVGWVHRRRDHGGVIFIDLRDREGLLQVVFNPDDAATFALAESARGEFVLQVAGELRRRPEGTANPALASGQVELVARRLEVLNRSETPPFHHDEAAGEDLRLRYRYLDLRRPEMLNNLRLRHRVTSALRAFLDAHGFVEVETPMLTKATPEGARDYLVPSAQLPGQVLRAAAVAAAVQAAADDVGARPLLPDRALLPRRGPARRPPARVHPARRGDVVPRRGWRDRADGGDGARAVQGRARGRACRSRFPACAGARPWTASARIGPTCATRWSWSRSPTWSPASSSRCSPARRRPERPGRGAARAGRRQPVTQGDRRLHGVRRPLRRARPGLHEGQRPATGRDGLQSPILKFLPDEASPGSWRAPAPPPATWCSSAPTRRRWSTTPWARCATSSADLGLLERGLAAGLGGRFPDVRVGRGGQALGGAAPPLHRAERRGPTTSCARTRAAPCRAPMTWC
jgi:hypothetical protein